MLYFALLTLCCFTIASCCSVSKNCWGSGCTVQVTGAVKGDTAKATVGRGGSISIGSDVWNAEITGRNGNRFNLKVKETHFGFNVRGTTQLEVTCQSGGSGDDSGGGVSVAFSGDGTAYGTSWQGHNCGFTDVPAKAKTNFVAINAPQWMGGSNCGRCARVRCADTRCRNTPSVDVFITDQCPECHQGDLDFSNQAFKQLTGSDPSRYRIEWDWITCKDAGFVNGNLEIYLKDGSNPWWFAFQPRNFAKPIESMEIDGSQLQSPGQNSISGYFFLGTNSGGLKGPFTLSLRSTDGQTISVRVNQLWAAGTSLSTDKQFA